MRKREKEEMQRQEKYFVFSNQYIQGVEMNTLQYCRLNLQVSNN